jgi:hypothetical protein
MRYLILTLLWLLPLTAFPESETSASMREVKAYRLTESGLERYLQATRNLGNVKMNCEKPASMKFVIDAAVADLEAIPGAKAAIQSAGMSTREYVLFGWAVPHNIAAAAQAREAGGATPQGAIPENIDFMNRHQEEIVRVAEGVAKKSGCGE